MRMPSPRLFVALLASLQFAACAGADVNAPDVEDPSLVGTLFAVVDTDANGLGSLGTLRVTNTGSEDAFFAPCTTFFERSVDGRWIRNPVADRVCAQIIYRVAPGMPVETNVTLPQGAEPGTYRLAIEFSASDPTRKATAFSNPFEAQ